MDVLKSSGKPFEISKREVWEAYRQVKANQGAPGVDGVTLDEFEADLKNNLYKIWNRMSSGSYFPPPVKAVEVPKPHGAGTRVLGVPTVADRIAQTVVARKLEAKVEPIFHPGCYGYRPNRSALDAVAACRQRCWKTNWVIDLDVERFFDSVPWELVVKAVAAHTTDPWVVLHVKRWLAAPLALPDGSLQQRDRGTPQGSAVSPVLANLFLHYAFDAWMAREHPTVQFERYADDVVVHCVTEAGQGAGGGDREPAGRGRAAIEPGQDPDRLLQGREAAARLRAHRLQLLGVHVPRPRRAREERSQLHRLPARGQQGRPEQDEQGGSPLAAAPAHWPHAR
jgi:RNA-directed DNA polymerase